MSTIVEATPVVRPTVTPFQKGESCVLIIFHASGDLTRRKLIPALYDMACNNIAPGAIETPINKALLDDPAKLKPLLENIPLRWLGTAEDVAGVAAFLASADSDYITGTTVLVDGGLLWSYEEQ